MKNDQAYNNVDFIPDGASYPERWEMAAREYREVEAAIGRARLNEPYGEGPREVYDLFHPAGPAAGLVVFVHGGYWLRFDKNSWSHLAAGATARGWCLAMPSYPLAPEARITAILGCVCRSIEAAAARVAGPIHLIGHSAGGHLVAMAVTKDSPLAPDVRARVAHVLPISPVSDLHPLMETSMNADLRIDLEEADAMSPALLPAPQDVKTTVWVGAEERPVFLDQARWLAEAWPHSRLHVAPGRHHFDVIEDLAVPNSPMMTALLG